MCQNVEKIPKKPTLAVSALTKRTTKALGMDVDRQQDVARRDSSHQPLALARRLPSFSAGY